MLTAGLQSSPVGSAAAKLDYARLPVKYLPAVYAREVEYVGL